MANMIYSDKNDNDDNNNSNNIDERSQGWDFFLWRQNKCVKFFFFTSSWPHSLTHFQYINFK